MYVVIWEYQLKADHVVDFETIYASNGTWAELFRKDEGYLGTELLRDLYHAQRYITIDRWVSSRAYETFLAQWHGEYEALDAYCKGLTEQEALLGKWESVTYETR
jgi:heme-degrading monooxygenase HmoA